MTQGLRRGWQEEGLERALVARPEQPAQQLLCYARSHQPRLESSAAGLLCAPSVTCFSRGCYQDAQ